VVRVTVEPMTSMERVLTTLRHKEPDTVPVFLFLGAHGAKELGLPARDYYRNADNVAEAQLKLLERYGHDCLDPTSWVAIEYEAMGGEPIFHDDAPPMSAAPILRSAEDVRRFKPPRVADTACLQEAVRGIALLKREVEDRVPIVGLVASPFSLPVMQLGYPAYLELMSRHETSLGYLLEANTEFCVEWANAQFAAGATVVAYVDPVSSATCSSSAEFGQFGLPTAKRAISRFQGPAVYHLASGLCSPILDSLAATGAVAVAIGHDDDLGRLKRAAAGRVGLLGNLNSIAACRWSSAEAEAAVKDAIAQGGPGGGFILSDGCGCIPCQVSADTLRAIVDAAHRWGRYPLDWVQPHATETSDPHL